jgi:cyclohexanone monooxygenase
MPIESVYSQVIAVTGVEGEHPLDVLVLATGFDAFTGSLSKIEITGRAGRTLVQDWADGPRALPGVAVSGFPNLFLITGRAARRC